MDIYLVVVRLIHIVAAVIWVGSGVYSVVILYPTLAQLGADSGRFMLALAKNRAFAMLFPVSAVLTVLAGILLYLRPGASGFFSSTGWVVLSIGALAGILGLLHGGAVLGRLTGQYVARLNSGAAEPGELAAMAEKLGRHANISVRLIVIALIGMASARYL